MKGDQVNWKKRDTVFRLEIKEGNGKSKTDRK